MRNGDSFLRTATGAAMLVASLLAWPVTGAAQLVRELALRDLHAVDRGHGVARAAKARIGLDAPGGEGERDQPEKDLDYALVFGD